MHCFGFTIVKGIEQCIYSECFIYLFAGDLPSTVEEVKALGNDYLVDIVARNMNYFIGKNGTYVC